MLVKHILLTIAYKLPQIGWIKCNSYCNKLDFTFIVNISCDFSFPVVITEIHIHRNHFLFLLHHKIYFYPHHTTGSGAQRFDIATNNSYLCWQQVSTRVLSCTIIYCLIVGSAAHCGG